MKNIITALTVSLLSLSLFTNTANADGFLSGFFEPRIHDIQKDACEKAVKKELTHKLGYEGVPVQSGFIIPDVFEVEFVSSREGEGDHMYFFNVRAEGEWYLALERDPFSSSRYLTSHRLVDEYRVVSLGILTEQEAKPSTFLEFESPRHIGFSGKAYCNYFSSDSKTPRLVSVRPGNW